MRRIAICFTILTLQLFVHLSAQTDGGRVSRFKAHIEYLADDKLKGRDTGTEGEKMARIYIKEQFEQIGLKPAGKDNSWFQEFDFLDKREASDQCILAIEGKTYKPGDVFRVFTDGGDGGAKGFIFDAGYGIYAPDLGRNDYEKLEDLYGAIVVIRRGSPEPDNPHSKFSELISVKAKIETAQARGAAAVIFVDPEDQELEEPETNASPKSTRKAIPAIWLKGMTAKDLVGKDAALHVKVDEIRRKGNNVTGMIDNGSDLTVVLGAHYDHLGTGIEGSLHRGEDNEIHNGADDNASGTSMIIELAKELKKDEYKRFNYVFIAFSGEERGLLGSNFYAKNPPIDLSKVNCMLNFDMVGRLDNDKNSLAINGTGTSPAWNGILDNIKAGDMKIVKSESGVGPSDQTSFYLKDIPVLHFFSGTHADYHKPSDDADKINYPGMDRIYAFVVEVLRAVNAQDGKLEFSQTKNEDNENTPKWKVTLGVVPDYMYDGEGMRIDGVTEGKPAANAKLQAGDVILQMGDVKIDDMMGYMKALSKFEKGQKTTVIILRNGKKKKKKVTF